MNIETEIIEIHKLLARILGMLDGMKTLPERVSHLEQWQSWLRGGLAVLAGGLAYLFRGLYGK